MKNRWGIIVLRLGVVMMPAVLPACVTSTPGGSAPNSINAADVNAWRSLGTVDWQVEPNGVTAGPSDGKGFLLSDIPFADFRLSVDFWVEDQTNSGIFIRCAEPFDVSGVNPDNCYEVNIWDSHPNQLFRTGGIVKHAIPIVKVDSVGHWNKYEIVAQGPSITVFLNGKRTAVMTDAEVTSGYIALQYDSGGKLRFRNLNINTF